MQPARRVLLHDKFSAIATATRESYGLRRSGKVTLPSVCFERLLSPDLCLVWLADRHGWSPLSVRESLPQPQFDSVQHCFIGVVLRYIRALQDLEGVVAAFHNV